MAGILRSAGLLIAMAGMIAGSGFTSVALATASAPALSKVEAFVLDTGTQAISMLAAADRGEERLKNLFRHRIDHDLIGRYALGGYWQKADVAQQAEYRSLFAEYVSGRSDARLQEFRDAGIAIAGSLLIDGGDFLVVTRAMPPDGEKIVLQWRVRAYQQDFKIIDFVYGGASYLTTLRQEFTSIAARDGVEGLLNLLRKQIAANGAGSANSPGLIVDGMCATSAIDTTPALAPNRMSCNRETGNIRDDDGGRHFNLAGFTARFDVLLRQVAALFWPDDSLQAAGLGNQRTALWPR